MWTRFLRLAHLPDRDVGKPGLFGLLARDRAGEMRVRQFGNLGPSLRSVLLTSMAVGAVACATPAAAASPRQVSLPAGTLDAALSALAAQTGDQLVYAPAMVAGRRVPALSGRYDSEEALARLLISSNLIATRAGPKLIVLKQRTSARPSSTASPEARSDARPFVADEALASAVEATPAPVRPAAPTTVESVEVTGTHIRGAGAGPSPVIVFQREDIDRTGHATLAGALNTLPQVFSGLATEGTLTTGADRSGVNATYGTGVNLRGLGPDATLVLINGRRMAGTGARGDFVDLSTIPTAAVQRVDILLDGASALYGSDAVGGVVNVILRKDYNGAETRILVGTGTAGEPREIQLGQTVGNVWSTGSVLLAYEFNRRGRLPADARPYTATTDLRSLGGTDRRLNAAHPGNILRFDPVTGTNVAGWAIPAGQNGVGLRPGDFLPGVVNLDNQREDADTLPRQSRHSVYLAARQQIGDRLELSGDVRYGYRRFDLSTGYAVTNLTVGRANPYFVSPNGSASHQIAYSFIDELPASRLGGSQESLGVSLGGDLKLPGDWHLEGYGAFAQEIGEVRAQRQLNSALLNEALGNVADRPETAFSAARDGFFNPFTGIAGANSPSVLAFIGSGFSNSRTRDRLASLNFQADGTLFQLPSGPLKVALGVQARRDRFFRTGASYTSTPVPSVSTTVSAGRDVIAAFAEARAPLVAESDERPGLRRLELSLAGRVERYDDFGTTTNPKVGLLWSPTTGVNLRGTYGRSFRAPDVRELQDPEAYSTTQLNLGTSRVVSLILSGGNPDLDPETATSWTFGVDVNPPALPGLKVSAGWFDIRFKDRIGQPARTGLANALTDPTLVTFVRRVSPATSAADLALINALLSSPATSSSTFPATSYGAIVDTRFVNTAAVEVRGVDVSVAYRTAWADHRVGWQASASYLYDYLQQVTPTSRPFDTAGVVNSPAKLRGRAAMDWSRGPWISLLAVNYADAYRDAAGVRIRSHATLDAQLSLEGPPETRWSGLRATLSVRNLLDRDPPFYDAPAGVGYDPANGDPIGRYLSLQITRVW
ncbi:MAG: TonB-dependent receptor [Alphaproteobacteria bacterium]|nr:TonB-dependent receptor [Alphaproteobacteria bacterium]MBU1516538.1 TonB-dependent receptor [Alphaproteobacteria bacterium]MBU2094295.1 TonB-dependent receptor [Alphaproteobacteria bacterium]MBU2154128.1 TonB-dependent receptor [Alphaproteobacteria bacterium]MBU2307465.1 TonB-dependent receptor [Alphaproteobacteria bacterium]